ncbi:MAG: pyrroline-5-carboxylate reductase [Christensenellaceae bacterium]|jgi:pyrroline-5-carboxylate reductase|nr:pyrroline-5-carboxylate reductase [Christensenellaceae bacterium]
MNVEYKIGFIGVGVMADAILNTILRNSEKIKTSAEEILIYDIDDKKTSEYKLKDVKVALSVKEIFLKSNIVIICVKPQNYYEILDDISECKASTVVSIMAGVKISSLKAKLNKSTGIVRVMPNTPCLIGYGMSVLCFDNVEENSRSLILEVFNNCGKTLVLDEDKFDAVTSISGSGPAYVYFFIEGLINAGMQGGLTYNESKELVIQTLIGASKLVSDSNQKVSELVQNVCSKGGTTIEAITYFKNNNFQDIIVNAVKCCRDKSKILSNKY